MNYQDAKKLCEDSLIAAANAHESNRYSEIKNGYDFLDGSLPRNAGAEFKKLLLALTFWDGWIDAENHDWKYYEHISKQEWPQLALEIVDNIRQDQDITNPKILDQFCKNKLKRS